VGGAERLAQDCRTVLRAALRHRKGGHTRIAMSAMRTVVPAPGYSEGAAALSACSTSRSNCAAIL
jgi:hypothetical protein